MKRWSDKGEIENPKIDLFLEEVRAVCRRHGLAISHEDGHGSFEIVKLDEAALEWLMAASDRTGTR